MDIDIVKQYNNMPDLHIITNMFDSERYEYLKRRINGQNKIGFCFETLFGLNSLKTRFIFEDEVKILLRYISSSNKTEDGEKTIFNRINDICIKKDSRKLFTQLWFLPSNNINNISQCLKKLMLKNSVLKNYEILCVNRKNNELAKDIKDEINKYEIEAKENNKHGLILLAGNMLSLGITLKLCDLVILLNNTLSYDRVLQQMYRCMTEGENKKIGIVVDLNISRVLNTCINYTVYNPTKNIQEKLSYIINYHLINIDIDYINNIDITSDVILNKLINIWKDDPINNFKILLKRLDDDYEEFDSDTQKLINKLFTKSLQDEKNLNIEIKIKNEEDELQPLPSGKEIIKENNNNNTEEEEIITISFTKDVLPYIIPLTCILTIKDKNMDFVNMLNDIKETPELLEIFDEQCLIWWNKKDLIDLIKEIIIKYFNKNSNTYNISIQFKMSLQSLIDNPTKLLELINDCLKPKEIEKKKYGEVFTPMELINEMLDKLPSEVWTNKELKWYDPAAGMGNFPIAVYLRLMNTLKDIILDDDERKKHIIENMLYMGELNKKNCLIIKQIFNIDDKYKLNLYEGDTLELNIKNYFKVKKFDIIIGNPPYNEELTKVGAKPLYNKFIEYYVDKCELLTFIVPSRWFSGGKGLDKFRDMMLNRKDIKYIKHFEDASKIFGKIINIEGGVNYFLIDKNYNGLCDYNNNLLELNKYDVLVESKYYNLIDKINKYNLITKYYISQDYYKIQTNDKRLEEKKTDTNILCYVSQQKGFIKYIDKNEITKNTNNYKIITARANGKNKCFGNTFIGNPNEVHTKSYISFNLNSKEEANSLLSYLKCKLPNLLLSLRKISQDISESTCKWIPLPPLDREWTNEKIYEYFNLSDEDVKLIKETKINGYK